MPTSETKTASMRKEARIITALLLQKYDQTAKQLKKAPTARLDATRRAKRGTKPRELHRLKEALTKSLTAQLETQLRAAEHYIKNARDVFTQNDRSDLRTIATNLRNLSPEAVATVMGLLAEPSSQHQAQHYYIGDDEAQPSTGPELSHTARPPRPPSREVPSFPALMADSVRQDLRSAIATVALLTNEVHSLWQQATGSADDPQHQDRTEAPKEEGWHVVTRTSALRKAAVAGLLTWNQPRPRPEPQIQSLGKPSLNL